jgi:hypothetical protein
MNPIETVLLKEIEFYYSLSLRVLEFLHYKEVFLLGWQDNFNDFSLIDT